MNDEPKLSDAGKISEETSVGSAWRIHQQLALKKAVESADQGDFADVGEVERFFKRFGSEA